MAGLSAAWELSRAEHRHVIESVTVYESSPRLGGKGASSRGGNGRIEEHGLHVWLGYYDNAFRLIREVYDELDRASRDPECPIKSWRDAFRPSDLIGVGDRVGDGGLWSARFGRNDLEPGDPALPSRPLGAAELVRRALGLLLDAARSLSTHDRIPARRVVLSASPDPTMDLGQRAVMSNISSAMGLAQTTALAAAAEAMTTFERSSVGPLGRALAEQVGAIREQLRNELGRDESGRRTWQLVDLVATCVRGAITDRLLGEPDSYTTIDHLDFREWLRSHGASNDAAWSPVVNAMYDFVFAYEDGDPERPAFSAGLGLFLATKLFFEYRGSIFWKMNAGMGDVVFAPLYQALTARGVRIELGHHVDRIGLDADRREVESLHLTAGERSIDPDEVLLRVKGLPGFRSSAIGRDEQSGRRRITLRSGQDFDMVVVAASLGAIPAMCGDLVDASPAWADMVSNVRTVATRGFQAWLTETESSLGWPCDGAIISGWARPFDTCASMSHLLEAEDWPGSGGRPRGLAYFCAASPDSDDSDAGEDAARTAARQLLDERIGEIWPEAVNEDGFRWHLLHGGFDAQYFTTNDEPADRYVQSLPGTGRFRLRADQAGFDGLVLAGDWINSGLNAGCIEAAVISGRQAANVLLGKPLNSGVSGSLYGLHLEGAPT